MAFRIRPVFSNGRWSPFYSENELDAGFILQFEADEQVNFRGTEASK